MKHKKSYRLLLLTLIGIIIYSCQKDDETSYQAEEQTSINTQNMDDIIKLGKKLENPYSVENMIKALNNLKKKGLSAKTSGDEIVITTTHLYVKFKPKNEDELSILKTDSTFILYDYPLDYEIEENGDFYRDPEVPEDQPTYQYCAVKVDKELPNGVENEILEELFIPDDYSDEEDNTSGKSITYEQIDALVDEALRITNNLGNLQNKNSSISASKWRPAGTIKVWDDNFNRYVGVEGVEVRARRWFTTHKGIANSTGYYSCNGRFRRKANYSIDWERYHFALQDGWLNGATYNGPKKRGNWDLNLNSGKQEYYATIFRAAYHYYYKYIKGLRRPPQNSFWRTQLKIRAYYETNSDKNGGHKEERRFLGAQIKIYNPSNTSRQIYAITMHELAHASHWNMWRNGNDFDNTDSKVKESWARGVQWELTRMVYLTYEPDYSRLRYTGVVQDMIDGTKTRTSYYYWTESNPWVYSLKSYSDQVNNYTIRQIEDALRGKKTWNDWKNNIINTYNNGTKTKLHDTFNHWNSK